LVGVTPVPGIGGRDTSGGTVVEEPRDEEPAFEPELPAAVGVTTTSVALDGPDISLAPVAVTVPVAVAVSARSVPAGASELTGTDASSSEGLVCGLIIGGLSIVHVTPLAVPGQMVKLRLPR
jgi:hypothetical protein